MANPSGRWLRYPIMAGTLLSLMFGNSGTTRAQHSIHPKAPPGAKTPSQHWFQLGRASWYGNRFQGQATASGEPYDMHQLTCAHRSLPLGALVKVTNLRNHKTVLVRVNDRGPAIGSRVIDLSYAAARVLSFRGITRVRLDLIDPSPSRAELALAGMPPF